MPSVKHSSEYSEKFNIFLSFLAENKFLHIIIWKFFDRMGETMDRVKKMIHTDYAYRSGLSGQNVTVAVMDTGIVAHPDLRTESYIFMIFVMGERKCMMIMVTAPMFRGLLRETEKCLSSI